MTNRIFPDWDVINNLKNPLTPGERALVKFLDDFLPPEWLIFAQPYLNGTRPDVIIFKPSVGVVIYEVKDWQLKSYSWQQKGNVLYVHDSHGEQHPIKNPIDQVSYYREKIFSQLLPMIGETIDQEISAFGIIKVGLYFHCESTASVTSFFRHYVKPHTPIFGYDFLQKQNITKISPDVTRMKSYYWQESWNNELLFWLNPPYHSLEQTIPLQLTKQQLNHAEPQVGHFRLRGVAGSGKTQVLAYRAGKLASQNKRVLILTFNITLWHYIRDMIQRTPFEFSWKQITLNHFHGFCKDILNHHGKKWPAGEGEELFRTIITNTIWQLINEYGHDKWDTILIDEGQDYYWEWYNLLCEFLTEQNELLLVCDKKQNIYQRELTWIDGNMKNVGFRGPWRELKDIFRLPQKIANLANQFSKMFDLKEEIEGQTVIQLDLFQRPLDPHIIWRNINPLEWLDFIWEAFELLKKKIYSPSDIVILLPTHCIGIECVTFFGNKGIAINHIFECKDDEQGVQHNGHKKKSFWNGDGRLKMSTVQSFKGWESLNVILYIPAQATFDVQTFDRIIYTAITRTRENLIILNENERYKAFGEILPKKWSQQNLE